MRRQQTERSRAWQDWVAVPMLLGNPVLARRLEERLEAEHGWSVRASSETARVRIVAGSAGSRSGANGSGADGAGVDGAGMDGHRATATPAAAVEEALRSFGVVPARARHVRGARPARAPGVDARRAPANAPARPRATAKRPDSVAARGRARVGTTRDVRWHAIPWAELQRRVRSGPDGVSAAEAARRLQEGGRNELIDIVGRSSARILLGQFASLPAVLLAAAAGLAWATRARGEAVAIAGVMALNAGLGFGTELHAERTVDSLRRLAPGRARVLRDGAAVEIPAEEVVVGDVLLLEPGDPVAADARVFEAHRLSVNEAPLTGESLPVHKQPADALPRELPLGERSNLVHLGTVVSGGAGRALVVATAADSMLGAIRDLAQDARPPRTHLQRELDRLGGALALAAGAVCAGTFLIGLLRGRAWLPLLRSAVSLGVAAIPEGLATVATSLMASGIQRLRRQGIYARSLDAIENLGAVDVVCFDKTGTLTLNQMSVGVASAGAWRWQGGQVRGAGAPLRGVPRGFLEALALCNEAWREGGGAHHGNGGNGNGGNGNGGNGNGSSTERALLEFAGRGGIDVAALRARWPRLELKQRSEHHPYMVTLHAPARGPARVAVKGSPQAVLERCTHFHDGRAVVPLDDAARAGILAENEALAGRGYRMLGVAERRQRTRALGRTGGLTWLGLVGLSDPLRADMPATLSRFVAAGIRPIVVTGDQPGTTRAIVEQVGLGGLGKVLDGAGLPEDAEALASMLDGIVGIARATPGLKLQAVRALQRRGHVVAMIGDGINDGPALRAADVGVTLGASGTDFAQAMSDLVLESDHPAHLLEAVAAGRTAHRNVRKSVQYLLSTNLSEVLLMAGAAVLGAPDPLTPLALLWTNLATDILPAIALGLEPPERDVLARGPVPAQGRLLRRDELARRLGDGGLIAAAALAAFLYGAARRGAGASAQTVTFSTLNLAQLLHAWSARHALPIGAAGRGRNRLLDASLLATLLVSAAVVGVPALRRLIAGGRMDALDAVVALVAGSVPLAVREAGKRRAWRRDGAQLR